MRRSLELAPGALRAICLALAWLWALPPGLAGAEGARSSRMAPLPEGYVLLDGVAALVDDTIVTRFEVERAASLERAKAVATSTPDASDDEAMKSALDALIDEVLILEEADELDLVVSEGDIDANLRRIKSASGWTDEQLEEAIQGMGFATLRAYREHTRREILKARTFMYKVGSRVNVGAVDVQRVLDEEYEGGRSAPEVRVATLLRRVGPDASESDAAEAYRRAQWLRAQADAAPELFGDLVRKYSDDAATRFDDGDLGWIRTGQFEDPALESALFETAPGQITPIVRTRDGFRFFRVLETRRAPVRDLEGLRNSIYDRLVAAEQERIYKAWLVELRQTHYVEPRL